MAEVLRGPEGALQAGAGDLQHVASARHRVLAVEGAGDGLADPADGVQVDPAGAVNRDAQEPGPHLDVDQLEAGSLHQGSNEVVDSLCGAHRTSSSLARPGT